MRRFLGAASFATVLAWAGNLAWADGPLNLETPTMGGMQFWTDQLWFRQWRIQKHAETGHYRLLDGAQVRRAWGSFAHCRAELDRYKRELELPPMQGKAVILLHGMGRSRASMQGLARYLAKDGYQVFNLSYSSTRHPIENHAAALASVVENLDGTDEIHLIGHSLGNLVIRHYLGGTTDEVTCRQGDPRIARIVMLAPPNHAPQMAKIFGRNKAFELLVGPSGQQLAHWDELEPRLTVPACPFGIIAGSYGQGTDWNCFLEGDHDLIVTVSETRLAGAHDFSLVPCFHTFIMDHPQVQAQTLRFLKFGNFVSEEQRQPIE